MILVTGTVRIHPERRQEAIELALWMSKQTEAEPGCLGYRFFANLEDPNTILVLERWENDDALRAHFRTTHMATFNAQLGAHLIESPTVVRYTIHEYGPL
jgi:quinol monooxygenase YgiN